MWAHKPRTKNEEIKINSNSTHETVNNLNSAHLKKNEEPTYYCIQRENNEYDNHKIGNTPA